MNHIGKVVSSPTDGGLRVLSKSSNDAAFNYQNWSDAIRYSACRVLWLLTRLLALLIVLLASTPITAQESVRGLHTKTDLAIIRFLRVQAAGNMYLDDFIHFPSPPRVNTNMILSEPENRKIETLFESGALTYFHLTPIEVKRLVIADPLRHIVVVYQHCCSIRQFSIVKYNGDLPKVIALRNIKNLTFAGFSIGSNFVDVTDKFGVPLKKSKDGLTWYYNGPWPDKVQTCGREWQLRFNARRLSAITISEGC